MNVMQILTVTTIAYFAFVAVWILKMEDFLQARSQERREADDAGVGGR